MVAFFVSLFVEMYGTPFILFFSKLFQSHLDMPHSFLVFNILGESISMDILMFHGGIILTIGMTLIFLGWMTLYKSIKKQNGLVINGIYRYLFQL